jgi:hypothetical protein
LWPGEYRGQQTKPLMSNTRRQPVTGLGMWKRIKTILAAYWHAVRNGNDDDDDEMDRMARESW